MDILSSCTFELEDIEIIDHKTENEEKLVKWQCDQCSLFFLEKEKLAEHKKKHGEQETVKCKYCSKKIPNSSENREGFVNRKCETCEYKCSKCPQRFLRHSSLMNHEKKHSSPKKKKTFSVHKANGVAAENIVPSKVLKRKLTEAYDSEEQSIKKPRKILNPKNSPKKKEAINVKAHNSLTIESACNKMSKRMSLKSSKSPEGKSNVENTSSKTPKRISSKTNKLPEEKNSDIKVKHNSITINSTTFPSTSNVTPNSENVVNYKPFSCHVCGDTFASDSALLDHIRTHGESAAKTFQCKFCSDKFDDIYKMQYHLAICPLAEDELESSLKRVIPANIPLKYSGGTSSPRKRGRPKKTKEFSLDQTDNDNESTPFSKRGTFRKRKSEIKEIGEKLQVSSSPVLPKQKKLHQKAPLTGSNSNTTEDDAVVGAIIADVKESEPNDDKKKLHHCPFPRCDFKFTREKALLCHMRNHSDDFEDSLKCHKCDIPFDDIHTLRLHINTCKGIKEERDEDFSRAGCYDSSPNRTSIKAKKDFLCIPCGRSYQNQEKLNSQQCNGSERTKVKKDLRRHKCNLCQAEFQSELEENDHMMTHTQKVAEHPCLRCFNYVKPTSVQQHKCGNQIIKSLRALIVREICQNNITPKIKAQIFNRTSSVPLNNTYLVDLKNRLIKQNGNKLFPCRLCKLSFVSKKMFMKHCQSHEKINNVMCTHCNRKFSSQKSLKRHECRYKKHNLKCSFCYKTYPERVSLVKHINKEHVKENNKHECKICNTTIYDASAVIDHFMFHTLGSSVDEETSKYFETELDLESHADNKIEECYKLIRNGKTVAKKLRNRSSYRNKVLTSSATPNRKQGNAFHNSLRVVKKQGTGQEVNQNIKYKREKDCRKIEGDCTDPKNKENVPENSVIDQSNADSFSEKIADQHKHLIKPCYVPLVNMNNVKSINGMKPITKNIRQNESPEEVWQSKPIVRQIKTEKDDDEVISDINNLSLKYFGRYMNLEITEFCHSKIKYGSVTEVGNYEDNTNLNVDDSVVIIDHLKVHKCSICLEIFESMEFLKRHAIVHI